MRRHLQAVNSKTKTNYKNILQSCLHMSKWGENFPVIPNSENKFLEAYSHDKWEMTKHNNWQLGNKGDQSMMLFKMLQSKIESHQLHNTAWAMSASED